MVTKKQHKTHKSHTHSSKEHAHKTHEHAHAHKKSAHKKECTTCSFSNETLKNVAIVVLSLALIAVLIWAFTNDGQTMNTKKSGADIAAAGGITVTPEVVAQMKTLADDDPYIGAEDEPIVMVEFSDFQCPYCSKFWKETLPDIEKNFVDTGVVKIVYRDLPLSFHNNAQNAAEAAECAHEQGKFWEYHDALFANQANLDLNSLKKYAADLDLDLTQFDDCLSTHKYADEIAADAAAANELGISGTPGFIINGQIVSGARPYADFEQVICAMAPTAETCANIEPAVEFTGIIINDKTCTQCDTSGIITRTKELFPGVSFRTIDVSSAEAKALIKQESLVYAPSYLFPEKITETKMWTPDIQAFFDKTSDGYRLKDSAVGASWFLSEEARAAQQALMAQYPKENLKFLGATGDKPRLDYFVMAFCPYGNPADEAAAELYNAFGDTIEVVPHYIIGLQNGQMQSLHGAAEGYQGVRELCSLNLYGEDTFFAFVKAANTQCSASNVETCWEDAATSAGLTADEIAGIQSCFDDDWQTITQAESDINMAVKTISSQSGQLQPISSSPTFLIDGESYFGGRDADSLKQALCGQFTGDKPAACDNVLTTAAQTAPPSGSC